MGSVTIAKSTAQHGRSLLTGGPCPHHQRKLEEASADKPCRALLSCVVILTKQNFVSVAQAQQTPHASHFNVLATFSHYRSAQKRLWGTLASQVSQLGYNIKLLLSSDLRQNPNIRVHGTIVVTEWTGEVEKCRHYGAVVEVLNPRKWDLNDCLANLHKGMKKRWEFEPY